MKDDPKDITLALLLGWQKRMPHSSWARRRTPTDTLPYNMNYEPQPRIRGGVNFLFASRARDVVAYETRDTPCPTTPRT